MSSAEEMRSVAADGGYEKVMNCAAPEDAEKLIDQLAEDERIQRMNRFIQHGSVTTLEHVRSVAEMSCIISRKMHLHVRESEMITGAMLHDYYLYDWHHDHGGHFHGFTHPQTALERAEEDFSLTDVERDIIRNHMWPLTLLHIPRSRESWIVCLADKICSVHETIFRR